MDTYSLIAGTVLVIVSIGFFTLPALLDMDAFIPVIIALVSFFAGVGMLFSGRK